MFAGNLGSALQVRLSSPEYLSFIFEFQIRSRASYYFCDEADYEVNIYQIMTLEGRRNHIKLTSLTYILVSKYMWMEMDIFQILYKVRSSTLLN